jgi:hypothetical protein
VALGVSIPPTLVWLDESNMRRADSVSATRASALATGVMEHILADVSSEEAGLGFAALDNDAVYLDTAVTGLRARIGAMTGPYAAMGMNYTVTIGPLVNSAGAVSGLPVDDVFRVVTVSVTFSSMQGGTRTVNISSMVAEL